MGEKNAKGEKETLKVKHNARSGRKRVSYIGFCSNRSSITCDFL